MGIDKKLRPKGAGLDLPLEGLDYTIAFEVPKVF